MSGDQTQNDSGNILNGSLLEINGWRDLASLVVTADSIKIIDLEKIKIVSPDSGATVTSPLVVAGFSKIADQKIYWRIKDKNNAVQLSGSTLVDSETNSYSAFRIEIYLPALETNSFTLELFTKQPSEVGLVSLPLNLLSINQSELAIYFSNNRLNTNRSCNSVFPITRKIAETSAVGRAALIELLNGPTESELYQGYRSSLPYNTVITSFIISGKIAKVTVSRDFEKISACEKQRAEEQIRQTLLQIELVEDVEIEVE